ncbi:CRISPR-associated protein Csy2 [Nitrosomonas sp. Nm51]|uniref:type I-F CRISPR-associated protein Csy2 n=1 Tax=Nitrosomonas sp. Nm51 TaxID=133720 RepID=UPI0008D0E1E0|nr:type I-F CRISPR-associated protein Csy2 [Nitrosomonas sp. Nm51]SER18119.1 CRISPR-associated protein Csy2 [Nitrosomonas sp. Nm51]
MNQYLLINHIQVQGANAVAGFTWGFPAITHFLGFTHHLTYKLAKARKERLEKRVKNAVTEEFDHLILSGCAVIAHSHQVHTYAFNQFVQHRTTAFQYKEQSKYKVGTPPVIEEGKMDMNVSLIIACEGDIGGDRKEEFIEWLKTNCQLQRLAGGTILEISSIDFFTIDNEKNGGNLRAMTRQLLPGFVLLDRSAYLEKHFQTLQAINPEAELFDAWMDFIALKQKARPIYDSINRHLTQLLDKQPKNDDIQQLFNVWQQHLDEPYDQNKIPVELANYFSTIDENKVNKKLLEQWRSYCEPNENTDAVWEYVNKPEPGFLVPIMTGYKAISPVYKNHEVASTRDNEADVCFVEAVHSIGEWQGVHRIKDVNHLRQALWDYHYETNWYLCRQKTACELSGNPEAIDVPLNDDYS